MQFKLLAQYGTPSGLCVSADPSLWPQQADLPPGVPVRVLGEVAQWINKKEFRIKIKWTEPDGR